MFRIKPSQTPGFPPRGNPPGALLRRSGSVPHRGGSLPPHFFTRVRSGRGPDSGRTPGAPLAFLPKRSLPRFFGDVARPPFPSWQARTGDSPIQETSSGPWPSLQVKLRLYFSLVAIISGRSEISLSRSLHRTLPPWSGSLGLIPALLPGDSGRPSRSCSPVRAPRCRTA